MTISWRFLSFLSFSQQKMGIFGHFLAGGLPQALFFCPNSVSPGKGQFSSAGGLPQALFFSQKWRFLWKNVVFAFYKGCQQSYREPFINFLALLGHSQRKSWFYHFFQKIFKKDILKKILFSINRSFRLGIFMISKKNIKKMLIFCRRPHDVIISMFFCGFIVSF